MKTDDYLEPYIGNFDLSALRFPEVQSVLQFAGAYCLSRPSLRHSMRSRWARTRHSLHIARMAGLKLSAFRCGTLELTQRGLSCPSLYPTQ